SRAAWIATGSLSKTTSLASGPSRDSNRRLCPPRPKVPSTYTPSGRRDSPSGRNTRDLASKPGSTRALTVGSRSTGLCVNSIGTSERKIVEGVRHALCKRFGFGARPFGRIPQFEVPPHSQKHDFARHSRRLAQFGRHQDAAGAVHFDVLGVAQQKTLQRPGRSRKSRDLFAFLFPDVAGVDQQAAIGMPGKGQTPLDLRLERVTMPGRNRDPPLGIQRECAASLKHLFIPTFLHKILLFPTLRYGSS